MAQSLMLSIKLNDELLTKLNELDNQFISVFAKIEAQLRTQHNTAI